MVYLNITLKSRDDLCNFLKENTGLIILKFTAPWCGPCNNIKDIVDIYFSNSPVNCTCVSINIDDSIDIFAAMKRFKVLKGVPGLLCYIKDETDGIFPSFVCNTGDRSEVTKFFIECNERLKSI